MAHTVVGIFEHAEQAQEAKSHLVSNGFSSGNVDISSGGSTGYAGIEGSNNTFGTAGTNREEGVGNRISNFFSNLFEDEGDASSHTEAGSKGTVVTIHAQTEHEALQAVEILDNYGAVDVNEYADKARSTAGSDGKVQVIKEELQVGKRDVETGGMRLRSRIVERPVEESIRLREEHVSVERTPVDRVATEADFTGFKEGTVEVVEHAERPVVAKEARIVEEVSLGKEVSEREETITDTVRHTEVDTEEIPGTEKTFRNDSN